MFTSCFLAQAGIPFIVSIGDTFKKSSSYTAGSYCEAIEEFNLATALLCERKDDEAFERIRALGRSWPVFDYYPFVYRATEVLKINESNHRAIFTIAAFGENSQPNLSLALKCIELDPTIPDYHFLAACFCIRQRAIDQALTHYEHACCCSIHIGPFSVPKYS
jgi:tetratricopeptide (TPR) repeat protein